MSRQISVGLSPDQALVLLEWLSRTGSGSQPAAFEDQAERRVLWDLEAALEKQLIEPLQQDYRALLVAARGRVRDVDE